MNIGEELFVVVLDMKREGIKDLICHDKDGPIMDTDGQAIMKRFDWISNSGYAEKAEYSMKKVRLVEVT
jgi:hypothetical protein